MKLAQGIIPLTEFTTRLCEAQHGIHSVSSVAVDAIPLELFMPDTPVTDFDLVRNGLGRVLFAIGDFYLEIIRVANVGIWTLQRAMTSPDTIIDGNVGAAMDRTWDCCQPATSAVRL